MSANISSDTSGIDSAISDSQEPSAGLGGRRCIAISLIRHAECDGNVDRKFRYDDGHNPLTERGRLQADSLGKDWADTRIDHLLSSPLDRAHDTAKALSSHNEGHPEINIDFKLIERKYGYLVVQLMQQGFQSAGQAELRGQSSYSHSSLSRSHTPEGGESMNSVAARAEQMIRLILKLYAVNLSEAPAFYLEDKKTDIPSVLPDGIPHVVIVSHNVFFMELYEKMRSWGRLHSETDCDWRNAGWSRHILWYDEESDMLDLVDMKYCC